MRDKNKKLVSALLGLSAALPANPQISAKNEVSETQKIQKSEQNFVPSFETGFSGTMALALTALGVGGIYLANKDKPFVKNFDLPSKNIPAPVNNPFDFTFNEIGPFINKIKAKIVGNSKDFASLLVNGKKFDENSLDDVKAWRKSCDIAYVVDKDGKFYKVTDWDKFTAKNTNGFGRDINAEGQTSVTAPEEEGYLKCIFSELHDRVCSTLTDDKEKGNVKISHVVFGLRDAKKCANVVLTLAYGDGTLSDPGGYYNTFNISSSATAFKEDDVDGFKIATSSTSWGDANKLTLGVRPLPILLANNKAQCCFAEIEFGKP